MEEFERSREEAEKVLVTVTGGYNHPTVTLGDVRGAMQILETMEVQTHAILRSKDKLVTYDSCESRKG